MVSLVKQDDVWAKGGDKILPTRFPIICCTLFSNCMGQQTTALEILRCKLLQINIVYTLTFLCIFWPHLRKSGNPKGELQLLNICYTFVLRASWPFLRKAGNLLYETWCSVKTSPLWIHSCINVFHPSCLVDCVATIFAPTSDNNNNTEGRETLHTGEEYQSVCLSVCLCFKYL